MDYSADKPFQTFPTLHVATCLCGLSLAEKITYRDLQEIASWLFGDAVYTHELAHEPTMNWVRDEGYRQFPDMPTRAHAQADWAAAAARAVAAYGPVVHVQRGPNGRREHPVATLRSMVPDPDKIIVVNIGEGGHD